AVPDNLLANKLLGDIYMQLGLHGQALDRYKIVQMITPADREVVGQIQRLEAIIAQPAAAEPEPSVPSVADSYTEEEPEEDVAPTIQIKAPEMASQPDPEPAQVLDAPLDFSDAPTIPPSLPDVNPWVAPSVDPAEPAPDTPIVDLIAPTSNEEPDPALAEIATILLEDSSHESLEPEKPVPVVQKHLPAGDFVFQESDVVDLEPDWEKQKEVLESQDRTQPIVEKEEVVDESADELTTLTLAELYERQGFLDKAVRVYQKLLLNDPTNEQIIQKLKELNPVDSLLSPDQPQPVASQEEPEHELAPQAITWEAEVHAGDDGSKKVAQLSEERRRKITTLEHWLASIRRER
ncbi:MAG TPA: hypothetical protein VJ521_13250, partial [Acidobacteriota bacterium]|nr:hypothetical protein [Acidobacteriota bacterium]